MKDKKHLLTFGAEEGACPTSVCWVVGEAGHCIVGYSSAACCILDTETGQVVTRLDTAHDPVSGQVGIYNTIHSFSGLNNHSPPHYICI